MIIPEHQRNQIRTWIKRSSQNVTRPELNWKGKNKWSRGLCACFEDTNMCCYACACWCCFRHEISTMMDEHWCLWFINCTPLVELRTKFRQQYSIEVNALFSLRISLSRSSSSRVRLLKIVVWRHFVPYVSHCN